MVGLWLAANAPERVDRLVAACVVAARRSPAAWPERAARVRAGGTASVADLVVERWGYQDGPAEIASLAREMLLATPAEGYAATCEALAAMDLGPDLGRVLAPTLVIAGADDPAAPPSAAAGDRRCRPRCRRAHPGGRRAPRERGAAGRVHGRRPGASQGGDQIDPTIPDDDRIAAGMKVRRAVLGDDHVDRSIAATTPFTAAFQEYVTGSAWGDVWSRPGLDRRTRSCITLAVLTALRAEGEIAMHVRAALRNGLTPDEIAEVLLHTAVYAGVPAGEHRVRDRRGDPRQRSHWRAGAAWRGRVRAAVAPRSSPPAREPPSRS